MSLRNILFSLLSLILVASMHAGEKLPHAQKTMPGPALSPADAIEKMKLPPGFKMECVASEPLIMNPTAFTFDEQGRIWVCESVEYPRASAGPGKDRIKMLESTKGDGIFDKATVIKDGLNIPCGVVMGNGGFYYTNAPDIVFAQLGDDGKIVKEEVILTGFGRADRHELPNSLTWGPDGWLYGMNGVFNPTVVVNHGKEFRFGCAVWRWHPKTKKFELFAEGTSNPWGLDYNLQGDWFVTCCVIKHLFHITQTGYYHRQGGPYPPFTQKIPDNLVAKEEHFMAANAGLCIYHGDAYPEEYRGQFFMGNLHGSQINRDTLTRNGSTYVQKKGADLIDAQDKWFMPVAQKVGPDGCMYIMDWYDKYHCYQDSGRPDLDRERGRIYRLSHNDTPRPKPFDLKKLSDKELLDTLGHTNQWQRREAQRLLHERFKPEMSAGLLQLALNQGAQNQSYMHALWLLCSQDTLDAELHLQLLNHADPVQRNWAVRMIGQMGKVTPPIFEKLLTLASDSSADVRLQVPIAAGRLTEQDPVPVLFAMLKNPANASDPIIPNIIYNNFKPLTKSRGPELMALLDEHQAAIAPFNTTVVKWLKECISGAGGVDPKSFVDALKNALNKAGGDANNLKAALNTCIEGFNAANVKLDDRAKAFDPKLRATISKIASEPGAAQTSAALMSLWWREPASIDFARKIAADSKGEAAARSASIVALSALKDNANFDTFAAIFNDNAAPVAVRKDAASALGTLGGPKVADILLKNLKNLPSELKSASINNLTGNKESAKALLDALEAKTLEKSEINSNHARTIAQLNDPELLKRLGTLWGKVRTDAERDPERVKVVAKMRTLVTKKAAGSALEGQKVFVKNCQQCHKIYGTGNDVGPDLTGVGRENLDLILNSVIDPNLVIGDGYYQHQVKLKDGTVLSGLVAEETEKSLSIKIAGGEIKKLSKDDIALSKATSISLMPEEMEKTMTEDEFCNLVAFLLTKEAPK